LAAKLPISINSHFLTAYPKCGHTPGKVAGQQATVKAEMNGFAPGLDRRPPFR